MKKFLTALLISLSILGEIAWGAPPNPSGGGVPSNPQPLFIFPARPLINPAIPNALEYDGTNLWLTGKNGTRGSVFSGNAPANFNNTVTFGSSGILDFNTGSVINFADGSVWKSTGLIFGSGTSLSLPDGSAWDSSGLIFGTGGTETLPDGSKWSSGGLTFASTFTNNGTISGGTLSGNTITGAYTFSPNSVTGPVPGQLIILSTISSGYTQLTIPTWANNIDIQLQGPGGGGASATYAGGGGGYVRYIGPIINLKNGNSSEVICYEIGAGGTVGNNGGNTSLGAGTSCSSASMILEGMSGSGASTSNGSQGSYSLNVNVINFNGSILYGNKVTTGQNAQQPGYVIGPGMAVATTLNYGVGGSVNTDGTQGVILVKFYP